MTYITSSKTVYSSVRCTGHIVAGMAALQCEIELILYIMDRLALYGI